ncbi:MAG: nucleotide kinase [Anaerovoracaceae bacterium]
MKTLIMISGTMGVGKTTTCRALQKILPRNVFLDGDWCWVMHEQSIIDFILSSLDTNDCLIKSFSLIADKNSLVKRIELDIDSGIRLADVIDRSVVRINNYKKLDTEKIDVSNITPSQTAELIKTRL